MDAWMDSGRRYYRSDWRYRYLIAVTDALSKITKTGAEWEILHRVCGMEIPERRRLAVLGVENVHFPAIRIGWQ